MLTLQGALRVLVATKPVDFRKGMDGLLGLVKEHLGADPFSGAIYVFRAKRADRVKLIYWDGSGVCLYSKRLEDGHFRWPRIEDGVIHLSQAQLAALNRAGDRQPVLACGRAQEPHLPVGLGLGLRLFDLYRELQL